MTIKELREKLQAKRNQLHEIFEQAGEDMDMSKVKSIDGDSQAKVEAIRALNKGLNDLQDQEKVLTDAKELEATAIEADRQRKGVAGPTGDPQKQPGDGGRQVKTLGQQFLDSPAYKAFKESGQRNVRVELGGDAEFKTLMETSAGWAPESLRTGRLVPEAVAPVEMLDVVNMATTGMAAVVYMEETTLTNNAAEAAEGGAYGEAALAYTQQSQTVENIGVFLPVTDQQLEDVPQIRGIVDDRLTYMLRHRLGSQILNGDGSTPNLQGILNVSGIQTQAKGADPVPDAIYKAMTLVRVTGQAIPSLVVLHPNDWQGIRLLRTSDGIYIWGSPSEAAPERIWGLPVVQAQAETENTGLVGDFKGFHRLYMRRGVTIKISDSHDDYFTKAKQAIRGDVRAANVVERPAAFCTITGI